MPTNPTPFTPLPDAPSTADAANFDVRADAFLGALEPFQGEANDWGTTTYNNAVEAASAATQALASANSAASSAGAPLWVSGNTYTLNTIVRSPATLQVFYVKVSSTSGTVDPSIDSTNWNPVKFTVDSLNGAQLGGFRNRIINGLIRVDQRNNGSAVTPTASAYTVDRFQLNISQASKLTVQRVVVDGPPGIVSSTKITTASAFTAAAGDFFLFQQPIEADNIVDFQLGLATAQTVTLSFWVKASIAGNYTVALVNPALNRSYVFTVAVTTSWNQVKRVIPLDTSGTWPVGGNGTGLTLRFDLGGGSTFSTATAGSWLAGNFNKVTGSVSLVANAAATLNLTGIQLELGTVATPFEQTPYGIDLLNCQRFYETGTQPQLFINNLSAVTGAYGDVMFKVTKRGIPTIAMTGWQYYSGGANTAFTPSVFGSSVDSFSYTGTGLTSWQGWARAGTWAASSEL